MEWGFAECGFGEESVGTLERNVGMMRVYSEGFGAERVEGGEEEVGEWGVGMGV